MSAPKYPTKEEVEAASQHQLGYWLRFLKSPGMSVIDTDDFDEVLEAEVKIIELIQERFKGWNTTLSKSVGWGR